MPKGICLIAEDNRVISVTNDGEKRRLDVSTFDNTDPKKGNFTNLALTNSGSSDLNIDGSGSPVSFIAEPSDNKNFILFRLILVMEGANMSWKKYGGISALTNGVLIKVTEDGVERELTIDPIKRNRDFIWYAYDISLDSAVTNVLRMRWTFARSGTVFTLKDNTSDNFKIIIQDDLTGIDYFKAIVQGYEIDE